MILASNNQGKLREIKSIFNDWDLKTLKEMNLEIDVLEDQDTFSGNALKKAKEIYKLTNETTISDDSGLCIPELNNWPGVLTHRFLGVNKTDRERNIAIIEKASGKKAQVICNIVYYDGKDAVISEGIIEGTITSAPRGDNGFGFDEIFMLPNGKTLAELTFEEKNEISARNLALQDLKSKLKQKEKQLIK